MPWNARGFSLYLFGFRTCNQEVATSFIFLGFHVELARINNVFIQDASASNERN